MQNSLPATRPASPIQLTQNWTYGIERSNELKTMQEEEGLCAYIWRIFMAMITCSIFCDGFPERRNVEWQGRQIIECFVISSDNRSSLEDITNIIAYFLRPYGASLERSQVMAIRMQQQRAAQPFFFLGQIKYVNQNDETCLTKIVYRTSRDGESIVDWLENRVFEVFPQRR